MSVQHLSKTCQRQFFLFFVEEKRKVFLGLDVGKNVGDMSTYLLVTHLLVWMRVSIGLKCAINMSSTNFARTCSGRTNPDTLQEMPFEICVSSTKLCLFSLVKFPKI